MSTAGGHRRFLPDEIERFARERGITSTAPQRPRRVLIADDDAMFREILESAINKAMPDVELHVAADGFEAGLMTQSVRPDVFLLDLNMPGLDGLDVCRRLRASPETRDARIVIITGLLTPEVSKEIAAAGADAAVEKAADVSNILRELEK